MANALNPGGAYLVEGAWRDALGNPLPPEKAAELDAYVKAKAEQAKAKEPAPQSEAEEPVSKRKK